MKRILGLIFPSIAILALSVGAASPASAADPFTVAKVPVDATAESAIAAQTQAIGDGQIAAARQLLSRLTLESERAAKGLPELTPELVGPLIRGLSIDNERRSATRYLGDVSIAFNPSGVQQLLQSSGLTMVSSQSRERLILPIGGNAALTADALSGRYAHALTPLKSPASEDIPVTTPDAGTLQALAAKYGVEQVLLVRSLGGSSVEATDISLDTGDQRTVSAVGGLSGLVAQMEAAWKQTSAVPSESLTSSTVSVLYSSMDEWQRLQRAINTSAQVRDARLDALSKDGALMTLRFGSLARLQAEMAQKGVRVEADPQLGLVIRR